MSFHPVFYVVCALLLYFVVAVVATSTTESACLARGYPDYSVTATLNRYCIKRVDQTDVVVPLR